LPSRRRRVFDRVGELALSIGEDPLLARATVDDIVAAVPFDDVVAAARDDGIAARAANDVNVLVAAEERVPRASRPGW